MPHIIVITPHHGQGQIQNLKKEGARIENKVTPIAIPESEL
jgi:hypothetical protein